MQLWNSLFILNVLTEFLRYEENHYFNRTICWQRRTSFSWSSSSSSDCLFYIRTNQLHDTGSNMRRRQAPPRTQDWRLLKLSIIRAGSLMVGSPEPPPLCYSGSGCRKGGLTISSKVTFSSDMCGFCPGSLQKHVSCLLSDCRSGPAPQGGRGQSSAYHHNCV